MRKEVQAVAPLNTDPNYKIVTADSSGTIEARHDYQPRTTLTKAIFDFDGTISLIRKGWMDVMVPYFVEVLVPFIKVEEDPQALRSLVLDNVMRLTGKQTIYQAMWLGEEVKSRGGDPLPPLDYKNEYLRRLETDAVNDRKAKLSARTISREEFLVPGVIELLEGLKACNVELFLASGTNERDVIFEAGLLDVAKYFGRHIYGARDEDFNFDKKQVIRQYIIEGCGVEGVNLVGFGDGFVEIQETMAVGGLGVAVLSDEENPGSGLMEPFKREKLEVLQPQIMVSDYRKIDVLLDLLCLK